MKVAHLNQSDVSGGASRAAYRLHKALCSIGVSSTMLVDNAITNDWTIQGPKGQYARLLKKVRPNLVRPVKYLLKTENPALHSVAVLPSTRPTTLNRSAFDVVNMHWVNGEMLSIADIGKLTKPLFWTLHDMWAFCGAEHYTDEERYCQGYEPDNCPSYESGLDLNRWVWSRKIKHWKTPIHIITPSQWLGDCARSSALMRDWPVSVIPYAMDTECWKPVPRKLARSLLGLPTDVPLLLFGAIGGNADRRKGFDLLQAALVNLRGEIPGMEIVVFGQMRPQQPIDLGFPVHYAGFLHDDISLRLIYSAANAMVIPSRQDNLPNTGLEAQACGTPVVAFEIGGLPDIVRHQETGYLAKAFDAHDLAAGIKWVMENDLGAHSGAVADVQDAEDILGDRGTLAINARKRAVARYDNKVVANQYLDLYRSVLG